MPVKKAQKVKKARAPRAQRAPSETNKKKSQKLKQVQKVNVNVTSGGGGGRSAPALFIPQQFRDTSGENVRLENILSSISRQLKASEVKAIPEQPVPRVTVRDQGVPVQFAQSEPDIPTTPIPRQSFPKMPDAVMNPAGSVETIFNAPINNTQSLPEIVADFERGYDELYGGATETITPIKKKRTPVPAIPTPTFDMETPKKRAPRKDKGVARGSIKKKYIDVGIEQGIPVGRDIQNEYVMGVEQLQARAFQPEQMRLVGTTPVMEPSFASSSSAGINFA
jgi:hypothetical protein